jgi:hypothetical protein
VKASLVVCRFVAIVDFCKPDKKHDLSRISRLPAGKMDLLAPPEWDMLLRAAQKNNAVEIHRLITEEGVSPNHANRVAQSALHIAALWGHGR